MLIKIPQIGKTRNSVAMYKYINHVILVTFCIIHFTSSEFITASLVGSAVLAGGWFKWDFVKDHTVCHFTECCNEKYVPYDLSSEYSEKKIIVFCILVLQCIVSRLWQSNVETCVIIKTYFFRIKNVLISKNVWTTSCWRVG